MNYILCIFSINQAFFMVNWFVQTVRIFACFSIQTIRALNLIRFSPNSRHYIDESCYNINIHGKTFAVPLKTAKTRKFSPTNLSLFTVIKDAELIKEIWYIYPSIHSSIYLSIYMSIYLYICI